ncbi:PRAME family member 20-like [Perognathus longimembris pacificus]|uniref:PRAME family member 20-like n=1 Tax=Perognathus longimembris pacificus TaxID=214514 RepID=UPI002018E1D7|nr:PRAME family member 20-like [Perognathus longimembris pacificus]
MSKRTPPSLQHLAMQSLLSQPALAISALEELPVLLFPSIFMEAYTGGHREVLKAMVQAWPFPCLPLGDLAQSPHPRTFKAVLDGLNLLLAKKERPSRWKLQVLGLQKEHPNVWTRGYTAVAQISYPDILTETPTVSCCSEMTEEQPLKIVMDLTIKHGARYSLQSYLLNWAHKRKARVQLCSRQLKLLSDSFPEIQKVLEILRLDFVQELVVSEFWSPHTMQVCAPYLSWMRNLRRLKISNTFDHMYTVERQSPYCAWKFKARYWHLPHVNQLHMETIMFHPENLLSILRSLGPLKTFSLHMCSLGEADLESLSQSPHTGQLQHLLLRHSSLGGFRPESLRDLLGFLACTLETLALDLCDLTDAQLSAILPVLSQCSQLRFISFYGNPISLAALQDLLSLTARMGHLKRGLYPAPLESYEDPDDGDPEDIDPERFEEVLAKLALALREMTPTHKVHIGTEYFHEWSKYQSYRLEPDGSWLATEESLIGLSDLPV